MRQVHGRLYEDTVALEVDNVITRASVALPRKVERRQSRALRLATTALFFRRNISV